MDLQGQSRHSSQNEAHTTTKPKTKLAGSNGTAISSGGGIFSGVFNYVTAEVGSFITNATGGVITVNTGGHSRRAKNMAHDLEMRRRKKKRTREWTKSVERDSAEVQPFSIPEASTRRSASIPDDIPVAKPQTKKRASTPLSKTTMPGSLFPRSPSLMPSERAYHEEIQVEQDERQNANWNLDFEEEHEAGPSNVTAPATNSPLQSPFRPPLVSSVKDAVSKFHAGPDVDSSMLLPSPPRRKGKEREVIDVDADVDEDSWLMPPPRTTRRGLSDGDISQETRMLGKERELSEAIEEHKRKEARWERDRDKEVIAEEEESFLRDRERDKDRIRKLEEEVERLKEELRKRPAVISAFPPPPPPPPPPLALSIVAPSALNASDTTAPFANARAALKHAPTPKEAPINPPRRGGRPTVGVTADKMAAFLSEMKTVRLRKVGSQSSLGKSTSDVSRRESVGGDISYMDSFDDSERSRLSISDLRTTREILGRNAQGHSVAGPSAPAREVSWASTRSASSNGEGDNSLSASSTRKRKRKESIDEHAEDIDHNGEGDISSQIQKLRESIRNKRRNLNQSISKNRVDSISLSNSRYPYRPLPPSGASQFHPLQTSRPAIIGASTEPASSSGSSQSTDTSHASGTISTESSSSSIAGRDTDKSASLRPSLSSVPAETPSLCSDNDADHPGHAVDSSTPPLTPPGISARYTTPPRYVTEIDDLEVDLVDKEHEAGPSRTQQKQPRRRSSPHPSVYLAKRIPASPLPNPSPKRPKPPSNSRRKSNTTRAASLPKSPTPPFHPGPGDEDDEEDPLSLRYNEEEEDIRSTAPPDQPEPQRKHRRRRSTLDQELRAAQKATLLAETEGEYSEDELNHGTFVGTGTRSKKLGFLAHGGAGGLPVWMGEGYVLGVGNTEAEDEDEDEDEREEYQMVNARGNEASGRPTVSRTRIPVPKSKPPMVMRGR
ncbi:hypothetical protein F5878DRAFT_623871 [Lentinula raphanica]|uniref:Uncharacterized protein n=1 Tax=Lentinula raphanica TaxID=153919 RepID=A0AA38P609_9AGAR|nr:hypothetical protein F5880DRAFT_1600615 [Lentinula raphanica]KAJ3836934.1 hypothetical protein F5878DRAFT_623871 [Lentinula raphanica]